MSALLWAFVGILLCLTIIGIPFGLVRPGPYVPFSLNTKPECTFLLHSYFRSVQQCIKIAQFVLLPFGKHLEETVGAFSHNGPASSARSVVDNSSLSKFAKVHT